MKAVPLNIWYALLLLSWFIQGCGNKSESSYSDPSGQQPIQKEQVFLVGGKDDKNQEVQKTYKFNVANNTWEDTEATGFWGKNRLVACFVLGNIAHLVALAHSYSQQETYKFIPATPTWKLNQWKNLNTGGSLEPPSSASCCVVSGKAYLTAAVGEVGNSLNTTFEFYTGVKKWKDINVPITGSSLTSVYSGVRLGACFVLNDEAYLVGGQYTKAGTMYKFDPKNKKWSVIKTTGLFQIHSASCFVFNGKAYLVGGKKSDTEINDQAYEFNPVAKTWSSIGATGLPKIYSASCFVLNGKAYLVGGKKSDTEINNETYELDLAAKKWKGVTAGASPEVFEASCFTLTTSDN